MTNTSSNHFEKKNLVVSFQTILTNSSLENLFVDFYRNSANSIFKSISVA